MQGFSHADRIAGRLNLLDPKRIQDTICKGKDIFGMLPEAYSVSTHIPNRMALSQVSDASDPPCSQYVDLFSQMNLQP